MGSRVLDNTQNRSVAVSKICPHQCIFYTPLTISERNLLGKEGGLPFYAALAKTLGCLDFGHPQNFTQTHTHVNSEMYHCVSNERESYANISQRVEVSPELSLLWFLLAYTAA